MKAAASIALPSPLFAGLVVGNGRRLRCWPSAPVAFLKWKPPPSPPSILLLVTEALAYAARASVIRVEDAAPIETKAASVASISPVVDD